MFQKITVYLLCAVLLLACLAPVAAAPAASASNTGSGSAAYTAAPTKDTGAAASAVAPENTEFERYREEKLKGQVQVTTGEGKALGYTPSPVSLTQMKGKEISRRALVAAAQGLAAEGGPDVSIPGGDIVSLPSSYDLRNQGKLTAVRDQGACGSCWAFATYGSLESTLKPGETWDFSENNLKNKHGYDGTHCAGGNAGMSTAYLARYAGPVSEANDPYNPYSSYSPASLQPQKHVQDVLYLPDRSGSLDNDNIKNAVQVYGGVYSLVYWTDASYNSATRSFYYSGTSYANHAITIVGWDDNYDRTKFRTVPAGNGAFIVRNSWGTSWGEGGYFYVSYYDRVIGTGNVVFTAESLQNYQKIYQYDTLGWLGSAGYGSDTAYFANVFSATGADQVAAAAFYTPVPNTEYTVSVYTDPTGGPVSTSGPLSTKTGTIAIAGYHTVRLDTPVSVASGQKFSVVVRLRTPGYSYPIPLERPITGFASNVNAATGQSYMSSNGNSWTDVAATWKNNNVCVKAFTNTGTPPPYNPVPVLTSISPTTATAGGSAFTLTVTGSSFISGSTVRWNGLDRATTFGSSTQLTAAIPASDIAAAGTASVTVSTPAPGGGTSGPATFTISATPPPPPSGGLVVTTETPTTYTYLGYSSTYLKQAQSLKAAGTGISQVAVALSKKSIPTQPITVSVRNVLGGANLATATITPAMVTSTDYLNPSWVTVPITVNGLTQGGTIYIVLSTTTGDIRNYYRVPLNSQNPYKDGIHYRGTSLSYNSAYDMLVKVWFTG